MKAKRSKIIAFLPAIVVGGYGVYNIVNALFFVPPSGGLAAFAMLVIGAIAILISIVLTVATSLRLSKKSKKSPMNDVLDNNLNKKNIEH